MNNDPTLTSSHDDLAAAFAAAEKAAPAAPVAPAAPAQTPEAPKSPTEGTPPTARGPDGRFASSGTAAPAAAPPVGTPAAPAQGTQSTPPADGGTPAVAAPATPAAPVDPNAPVVFDPAKPPSGWKAEAKAKWESIPEDLRQEITRREEASYQGVQRLRKQMEPMETLYRSVAPHVEYFQHIQTTPQDYISNVIATEQMLNLGNPAQKMQVLLDLAEQYGVPLRQVVDSAMGGKLDTVMQQAHQQHRTPPAVPPEVARELQQLREAQQKMVDAAADAELRTFEATSPPFYEQVRDTMADLLEAGVVQTYQEAYDLAVWRNPALRQQSIAQQNGAAQQQGIAARQAAAAAVSTPASAPLSSPAKGNENESTEDTVRRAWAAATGTQGSV